MCGGPAWKREVVQTRKFDHVDVSEFRDNGFSMRMKYMWLYMIVLKSFFVYVSDIFSAITMLTTNGWHSQVFNNCPSSHNGCFFIPFRIGRWLFVGCILFSFLLLAYESRKAKRIHASRDISYAFTNVLTNHYYSLRSYDHFCFFDHISNSTKISDEFAFFVFFAFKSWKRLLLADGPRQTINALTLYAIYLSKEKDGMWYDVPKYFANNTVSTSVLMVTTSLTVVVFAGSLLVLVVAGICYIPLLCHIRGNLKEYCCHKVDKRIDQVIKRRRERRLADSAKNARKEAMGDFTHLKKNKKGELVQQPLPQPTLPNLSVDDDDSSSYKRPPPSNYTQDTYYYSDTKSEYPPMPAYNPYSNHQAPDPYAQYNPSVTNDYPPQSGYEDDIESLAYLPSPASYGQPPYGRESPSNPYAVAPTTGTEAHEMYPGQGRRTSPPSGLSYNHVQEYAQDYSNEQDPYAAYLSYAEQPPRPPSNESVGVGGGGRAY